MSKTFKNQNALRLVHFHRVVYTQKKVTFIKLGNEEELGQIRVLKNCQQVTLRLNLFCNVIKHMLKYKRDKLGSATPHQHEENVNKLLGNNICMPQQVLIEI